MKYYICFLPCSKSVTSGILNVTNVKRSWMSFPTDDRSNTTQISSTSNHAQVTRFKTNGIQNLCSCDFQLDGIVNFYHWVRIANSSGVMCYQKRYSFWTSLNFFNFAKFVLKKINYQQFVLS